MPGLDHDLQDTWDINYLRDCLRYDSDTGLLFWKFRPPSHFNSRRGWSNFITQFAGKRAGTINAEGYVVVSIFGKMRLAHRLAWAIFYGTWPEDEIDHKDRDRTNKRILNLRIAGPLKNSWNQKKRSTNTSGEHGVSWSKHAGRWRARLQTNGKTAHLGYFESAECASKAITEQKLKVRGAFS